MPVTTVDMVGEFLVHGGDKLRSVRGTHGFFESEGIGVAGRGYGFGVGGGSKEGERDRVGFNGVERLEKVAGRSRSDRKKGECLEKGEVCMGHVVGEGVRVGGLGAPVGGSRRSAGSGDRRGREWVDGWGSRRKMVFVIEDVVFVSVAVGCCGGGGIAEIVGKVVVDGWWGGPRDDEAGNGRGIGRRGKVGGVLEWCKGERVVGKGGSRGGRNGEDSGGGVKFGAALPEGFEDGVAFAGVESVVVEAMKLWGNKSGGRVEDEWDSGGVVRRVTEEDADSGAVGPFVMGVLSLQGSLEDVDGAAKGVEVEEVGVNVGAREAGERGLSVGGGKNTTAVFPRCSEVGG